MLFTIEEFVRGDKSSFYAIKYKGEEKSEAERFLGKFKDEYPLIHQFKMTTLPLLPLISMMLSRFGRS